MVTLARAMGLDDVRSAGITEGLVEQKVSAGTLIGFATQPEHVAYDGPGDNGYFTEALLQQLQQKQQEHEQQAGDAGEGRKLISQAVEIEPDYIAPRIELRGDASCRAHPAPRFPPRTVDCCRRFA